jgi:hypothetical protein
MSTDPTDCPACHGTGQYIVMQPVRLDEKIEPLFCSECRGTGKKPEKPKVIEQPTKSIPAINIAEAQANQSITDALPTRPFERRYNDANAPNDSNAPSAAGPPTSARSPKRAKATKRKIA